MTKTEWIKAMRKSIDCKERDNTQELIKLALDMGWLTYEQVNDVLKRLGK